ncbi:hypothetical protein [Microbacterium elymi]|uniref:Uncharacterized protein n=1 Tax=Microbacterium elymi TaxID=2909587 RepID=A0ABY5NLV1_9MICO|nr:hypothetical protein [Microbacterium elymi]UUT36168.1 hypothetical protein L2X98_24255 [Microbacterium elymi]
MDDAGMGDADAAAAATEPAGQYVALLGQRAFYRGRHKAVATGRGRPDDLSLWSLYDIVSDPAETEDLATEHPALVAELAEAWRQAAWHNTVFPEPDEPTLLATRPSTDLALAQPVTLRPGMPTLERFRSSRLIGLRSFAIEIEVGGALGDGVLVAHGDQGGGYLLWAEAGVLHLGYNAYGDLRRTQTAVPASVGRIIARFEALRELAWRVEIEVDGAPAMVLDRVAMLVGMAPFTGISVGRDAGGPVDWEACTSGTAPSSIAAHCSTCGTSPARRPPTTARSSSRSTSSARKLMD